jgi:hypothetical protein
MSGRVEPAEAVGRYRRWLASVPLATETRHLPGCTTSSDTARSTVWATAGRRDRPPMPSPWQWIVFRRGRATFGSLETERGSARTNTTQRPGRETIARPGAGPPAEIGRRRSPSMLRRHRVRPLRDGRTIELLAKHAKSVSAVTQAAKAAAGRFGGRSRAERSRSLTPQSYARLGEKRIRSFR